MRQAPAQASTQKTHTTIFSFSLPQTSQPLFPTSQRVPQKVEAARITIAARKFMSRRSQSTSVLPVETFRDSSQVLDGVNRFTELHHRRIARSTLKCGGIVLSAIIAARGNCS